MRPEAWGAAVLAVVVVLGAATWWVLRRRSATRADEILAERRERRARREEAPAEQLHLDAIRHATAGATPQGPATVEEADDVVTGRVGEPVFDESIGTTSRDGLSESADLDGDVPDDAVGEAREQWWDSPTDDVDDALRGR